MLDAPGRRVAHDVRRELRVGLAQAGGAGDDAGAKDPKAQCQLYRSRSGDGVAHRTLVGADRHGAEHTVDRGALRKIPDGRAGAVGVHIVDVRGG